MRRRNEIVLLAALVVVAAGVWHFERNRATSPVGLIPIDGHLPLLAVESSDLDFPQMEAAKRTEYLKTVRNIFSHAAPPPEAQKPKPDPKPSIPEQQIPVPPPDPKLPPNLKFFGYGTVPNGTLRRAFFTDGEDVYIVSEGETLLGRYRILKVGDANLQFEEVTTGRRGTAAIEEQGSGPSV